MISGAEWWRILAVSSEASEADVRIAYARRQNDLRQRLSRAAPSDLDELAEERRLLDDALAAALQHIRGLCASPPAVMDDDELRDALAGAQSEALELAMASAGQEGLQADPQAGPAGAGQDGGLDGVGREFERALQRVQEEALLVAQGAGEPVTAESLPDQDPGPAPVPVPGLVQAYPKEWLWRWLASAAVAALFLLSASVLPLKRFLAGADQTGVRAFEAALANMDRKLHAEWRSYQEEKAAVLAGILGRRLEPGEAESWRPPYDLEQFGGTLDEEYPARQTRQ